MLKVEALRVHYRTVAGDVKALDGATFEVADGEIMGLAGESGSGKSTLAKALIRLDSRMRYVEGKVELDGVALPVWNHEAMVPFRFKQISIVPQYAMSALNPTRRIGKMIADLLRARDVAPESVQDRLLHRLDLVGLPVDVLRMYPIELSGGMKQRIVTVLSTLLDPSVLIADEITSALDVASQKAVAGTLIDFRERGFVKSMIVVSHDLAILAQIADSILIMYAGKLMEKATTATLIEAPAHPYTRLLLDTLPQLGVRYGERPLSGIAGGPPSLLEPPSGCRFRDRCPLAFERCVNEPPFAEIAHGHHAACWRADPRRPTC